MPESMIFVGREDELEAIHRLISEREKAVICVKGRSKMGKSYLVKQIDNELTDKPLLISIALYVMTVGVILYF
ncbi:ATP-binding protein [Nitrospinae bacterium AH_259_B05_G02_I21]|nr:ATP-binding protein [Nitrospinae bacterium AH_259_B05_G02_I21]MDA2932054.1 ATP-binding protein [Nitrospinae bacterium AH-259-F20]